MLINLAPKEIKGVKSHGMVLMAANAGLDLDEFARLFGYNYKNLFVKQLENIKTDYYTIEKNRVRLTYTGRLFADAVAMELFA